MDTQTSVKKNSSLITVDSMNVGRDLYFLSHKHKQLILGSHHEHQVLLKVLFFIHVWAVQNKLNDLHHFYCVDTFALVVSFADFHCLCLFWEILYSVMSFFNNFLVFMAVLYGSYSFF
jgi:hypothetical protein